MLVRLIALFSSTLHSVALLYVLQQTSLEYGIVVFNVPLDTLYRSFRRRFYGSDDPTNSVIALKDDG